MRTPMSKDDDSLDTMFAMVEQKERQQRRIDELRREREEEEAKRRAEIERLKEEKRAKRITAIKEDIRKYEKIVSSPFGKDMKASAWRSLADKYPEAKGLDVGDIARLKSKAGVIKIINRDGRFIAYENSVVLDTKTGLMWAAKDNGEDITWHDAKSYCANYNGGGYSDWRMPTQDELAELYDPYTKNRHGYYVTKLIDITRCCPWASNTRGSKAAAFNFHYDTRYWDGQSYRRNYRALPVRAGN